MFGPVKITEPVITIEERKLNYSFMCREAAMIMLGRNDVHYIREFCSKYTQFSDDGSTFFGAYGPRVVAQRSYVVSTLLKDENSRQAVMTLWERCPNQSKDIPCTISMQFLIRGGGLHCIVYMRSSDAWLGIPYDVFTFSMITWGILRQYNLRMPKERLLLLPEKSTLTIVAGSRHLYAPNFEAANALINNTSFWKDETVAWLGQLKTWQDIAERMEILSTSPNTFNELTY